MKTRSARGLAAVALAGATLAGGALAAQPSYATGQSGASTAALPPAGSYAYGWSAVVRHSTDTDDNKGALAIVSPTGSLTTIGPVSDDAGLQDTTQDMRHVLTSRHQDGQYRITVWDTATKKPTYFRVPDHGINGLYLAFGGDGILVQAGTGPVESRTLTGALVRTLSAPSTRFSASPGGSVFYQTKGKTIVTRNAKTGAVLHTWAIPARYAGELGQCDVAQQWDATSVSLDCSLELGDYQSFRIDTATGKTTPITPQSTAFAYPTTAKRLVSEPGESNIVGYLVGSTVHDLPGLKNGYYSDYQVSGAYGSTAYVDEFVWAENKPHPTASLLKYDLATNAITRVAGSGSPSGGVISYATTIDGHH
ncbi:hypothetical protein [Luteipulveratus mongoliensis]|uniref:Uncharacterized protein n=1 Tax=Luteipulveratus mongoliensis TaxID=571913 RepID=A0A0K1JNB4_9MICO|nr:hypothetical protein [Luteipulveratus mongoliensis]AKU18085.1 hypothetical protein VV02_23155 [Luteipulveratus mongoliensis]